MSRSPKDLLSTYLSLPIQERPQHFASTTDAAKWVGVTPRTMLSWVQDGKVEAFRLGRSYVVSLDSLRRYLSTGQE